MATTIYDKRRDTELTPLAGNSINNTNSSRAFVCSDIFKSCTMSTAHECNIETGALCSGEQLRRICNYTGKCYKSIIFGLFGVLGVLIVIGFVNAHSPQDAPNDFSGSSSQSLGLN